MTFRLCYTFVIIMAWFVAEAQSPHGKSLKIDCIQCHSAENWAYFAKTSTFNHNKTDFALSGQHADLDCRSCHSTLVFNKTGKSCINCHTDFHQQTVGTDCARCHTSNSWIVENITEMHEKVSFPLMGAHSTVNCNDCHKSETNVRFNPINPDCITCHQQDYNNAKMPDHSGQNFSLDCAQCHRQTGADWISGGILHSFFPLESGHKISDCTQCHKSSIYKNIDAACINCHNEDFTKAKDPDHTLFPKQCNLCHTLAIGWMPAAYTNHDNSFPIYSGKHKGKWDQCNDCHKVLGNYSSFTCIECHEHNNAGSLAKDHSDVKQYQFLSSACYNCHPKGQ